MKLSEMSFEQISAKVAAAKEFARRHFRAYVDEETTPSGMLDPITCLVEFPDADMIRVRRVLFGEPFNIFVAAEYRLAWKGGRMFWKGGFLMRPDIVVMIEVKE